MAIVGTNLTFGEITTGVTNVNTASVSPASNALIIVSVSDFTGTVAPTSVTGNSLTYVKIADIGDTGGLHRVAMYRAMGASPTAGVINISYGATSEGRITWSVEQFTNVDTTGTNGSGAVVQFATTNNNGSGTTTGATITLAALGSANNAAYGFIFTTVLGALTKGASFTELCQNAGDGIFESQWAINQTAIPWTWTTKTSSFNTGIGIEIKAGLATAGLLATQRGAVMATTAPSAMVPLYG